VPHHKIIFQIIGFFLSFFCYSIARSSFTLSRNITDMLWNTAENTRNTGVIVIEMMILFCTSFWPPKGIFFQKSVFSHSTQYVV